jgi:hypothetical protein
LLYDGQIVFSKLDVPGLQAVSHAGGGQFTVLRDFPRLVDAIAQMHGTKLGAEERLRHVPRYQWFIAAAIALLCMERFIHERRSVSAAAPMRAWQEETA